jgi:hypothetical protein
MKIMNAVYKPLELSVPPNGRIIIFWSSTKNEVLTRARPDNRGNWNPNHFVPLVHQHNSVGTSNNERAIRIPDVRYRAIGMKQIYKEHSVLI